MEGGPFGVQEDVSASTTDTNWESQSGLPSHQAPSDPHICAMNLQNLFGCHEILQLRGRLDTGHVAFPVCVDCGACVTRGALALLGDVELDLHGFAEDASESVVDPVVLFFFEVKLKVFLGRCSSV